MKAYKIIYSDNTFTYVKDYKGAKAIMVENLEKENFCCIIKVPVCSTCAIYKNINRLTEAKYYLINLKDFYVCDDCAKTEWFKISRRTRRLRKIN